MEIVTACHAATLLPIIQAHMAARTAVYSDHWAAYNGVQTLGNVAAHSTVNHSLHFVYTVTDKM